MITPCGRHFEIVTINCNKSTNVKNEKSVEYLSKCGATTERQVQQQYKKKRSYLRLNAFCCTGTC